MNRLALLLVCFAVAALSGCPDKKPKVNVEGVVDGAKETVETAPERSAETGQTALEGAAKSTHSAPERTAETGTNAVEGAVESGKTAPERTAETAGNAVEGGRKAANKAGKKASGALDTVFGR